MTGHQWGDLTSRQRLVVVRGSVLRSTAAAARADPARSAERVIGDGIRRDGRVGA